MGERLAPRWHVAQIGAREHYALARAAHHDARLARLYTDIWSPAWLRHLTGRRGLGARLSGRFHADLHEAPVSHCTQRTLLRSAEARWMRAEGMHRNFLRDGARFGRWLADEAKRYLDGPDDALFVYNTGALEALQLARRRQVVAVVGQIDPAEAEYARVLTECRRFPEWATAVPDIPAAYWQRMRAEWDAADLVLVNSEWSRQGLLAQGVPEHKLVVAPLAYEARPGGRRSAEEVRRGRGTAGETRVLFLGEASLRKGIHYLFEAARALRGRPVRFDVVGPVAVPDARLSEAPSNIHVHGPVAREEAPEWFARADVFVLPTISDGFALTQLEALAHGVPVIATEACGEVVTHGHDGFRIQSGSAEALIDALEAFLNSPGQHAAMRAAAQAKAGLFTLDRPLRSLDARWRQAREASI